MSSKNLFKQDLRCTVVSARGSGVTIFIFPSFSNSLLIIAMTQILKLYINCLASSENGCLSSTYLCMYICT